ncbi:tetratricopeptide repeat protein [Planctomycetota bacterium]
MLQKAVNTWRPINYHNGLSSALSSLGQLYSKQGRTEKALEALHESLEIMTELGLPGKAEVEELIAGISELPNTG